MNTQMIGVVGLGLIGGSLAKAFNNSMDHTVYGYDISDPVVKKAKLVYAIEGELTDQLLSQCDIVIVALYPEATINFINKKGHLLKPDAIMIDTCGIKTSVCAAGYAKAKECGFTFIGGHPMAGIEHSGFAYAKTNLFTNASMILVPEPDTPIDIMDKVKRMFVAIGFVHVQITTPENHDRIIAFTSQLPHVASSAFIKSPTAAEHYGYSAGSYHDLSRVSKLNEDMWTDLFLENRDNIMKEVDLLIVNLTYYKEALETNDEERLRDLLKAGRIRKEIIDEELF